MRKSCPWKVAKTPITTENVIIAQSIWRLISVTVYVIKTDLWAPFGRLCSLFIRFSISTEPVLAVLLIIDKIPTGVNVYSFLKRKNQIQKICKKSDAVLDIGFLLCYNFVAGRKCVSGSEDEFVPNLLP